MATYYATSGDTTYQLHNKLVAALIAYASGGGGGGSVAWGAITGILSAQTDLQNALDAKANLSGGNSFDGVQQFSGQIQDGSGGSNWSIAPDGTAMLQGTSVASLSSTGVISADAAAISSDGAGGLTAVSFTGLLTPVSVPASSADPGQAGQYAGDVDYFYYYVTGDGWRRVAGSSF